MCGSVPRYCATAYTSCCDPRGDTYLDITTSSRASVISTASPWGEYPEMKRPGHPRRNPILVIVLLLTLLFGYLGGSYLVQHALADSEIRLDLAIKALDGGFDGMAVKLLTPLAETGGAQAQYRLAIMYEHGWGTPRDDKRAVGFYRKAANQGLASAQARLGEIYLRGAQIRIWQRRDNGSKKPRWQET